jgi:HSP20 family protein
MVKKEEMFSMDLSENADTILLTAQLPGMKREDIQVTVTENALTIQGEAKSKQVDEGAGSLRVSSQSRTFAKRIPLPSRVNPDRIEAVYKDDVLRISMPKRDPGERWDKSIEIK